jgi:hypothetical protein
MAWDGLADVALGLFEGLTGCNAAWEVGDVGCPIGFGFLENYGVFDVRWFSLKLLR